MKTYRFCLELDFNRELTEDEVSDIEDTVWEVIASADDENKIVENTSALNLIHHVLYKMEE